MSEELLQRGLDKNPEKIGKWDFYSIGATTIKALKEYGILHNIDYGASERKKVDALIVCTQECNCCYRIQKTFGIQNKEPFAL